MASRVKSAMGGEKPAKKTGGAHHDSKKAGKKKVHRMSISRMKSGHFLVNHQFDNPEDPGMGQPSEDHAVDPSMLASHVADNMGAPIPAAPASPAPAAMPPGGMGA